MKKGILYTLSAGIAWGLSGASGQYLMSHGFSPLLLTTLRLLIAGLVLTLLSYFQNPSAWLHLVKDKKSLLGILIFALLGLVLNQFAYLTAIRETNAGTATVLQYVCPAIVLAFTCLRYRQKPSFIELFSLVLAMLGTFFIATHGQFNQLAITPRGLFWGLFSALTYAIYIILPVTLIKRWGSLLVVGLGMVLGGLVLLPFSKIQEHTWSWTSMILISLLGIIGIGTIFAYTVFLKGTSIVGPVKSSLLASIEPVSAVFFAVFLLGEHFYAIDFLGMILILVGVSLISLKDLFQIKKRMKSS